jgi:hypothetical protein
MKLPIISLVLLLSAAGQTGAQTRVGRFDRLPGDPLLAIIDRVPSFAGMWIDSARIFHGSLTDLKDSLSLRLMLQVYASPRGSLHGEESRVQGIVIERAKYTYAQLFDWKCTIEKAVAALDAFQGGGISQRTNTVHIGVVTPEAIEQARVIVRRLGIPLDALDVELEDRISSG